MTASLFIASCFGFLVSWRLTRSLSSPGSLFYYLDHPNERSLHQAPLTRSGGLGIGAGILAGLVVYEIAKRMILNGGETMGGFSSEDNQGMFWILALSGLLAASSYLDDRLGLPIALRLGIHLAAAIIAVWVMSPLLTHFSFPGIGDIPLGVFGAPVAVLFIIWAINLYNFMDGMDGFAAGMTVIGFSFLSIASFTKGVNLTGNFSLVIAFASAGFLSYNFPPARVFMGDVGSIPLGFLMGSLSLKGFVSGLFDFWVPVLIFSPFIADATVTLIRRILRGEAVWRAHRSHYYQRLVLSGWGHRKTVIAEYGLMVFCGIFALIFGVVGETGKLAILLGIAGVYFVIAILVYRIERFRKA